MRRSELLLAAAAMAVVSAFWGLRTEGYEFMTMDDPDYVFNNDHVKAGFTAAGFGWAVSNVRRGNNWHPATWVSLMADAELSDGELEPMCAVMHRHNAVLHGFCAALLFILMLRLAGAASGWRGFAIPFLLTLVWALHPLRAECVCWVAERKEILCTAYALLAILLWEVRKGWATALAVAAYALALCSKSVAVTVPAILVALDLMREPDFRRLVRARWGLYVLLLAFALGVSVFTLIAQAPAVTPNQDESTFAVKVANAFGAYAIHFSRVIAPVGLSFSRSYVDTVIWTAFIPGFALVGLMLWSAWRYLAGGRRHGVPSEAGFLAAAWIGVGLLPMCGLLRVGMEFNPDRYGHWVGAGLTVVAAMLLRRVPDRMGRWVAAGLAAATVVYAVLGWNHAATFRNAFDLFMNTLERNPGHAEAMGRLSVEYYNRFNDIDKAIEMGERSIAAGPDDTICEGLIMLLTLRAHPEDYRRIKGLGRRIQEDHSLDQEGGVLTSLGIATMHDHDWKTAISLFEDAIVRRKAKGFPIDDNRIRIAMCRHNAGDLAGAEEIFRDLAAHSENAAIRQRSQQALQSIRKRQGRDAR